MKTIYLAVGLFNAGERLHNLFLEKYLKKLGHNVVLPQREALKFDSSAGFNLDGVKKECKEHSTDPGNIYVGSADGADADGGTAVEYGLAIGAKDEAVVYRTDIRTDTSKEIGVNAMLLLEGTAFVCYPCYFTELEQVEKYYEELANKIHCAVQSLPLRCRTSK